MMAPTTTGRWSGKERTKTRSWAPGGQATENSRASEGLASEGRTGSACCCGARCFSRLNSAPMLDSFDGACASCCCVGAFVMKPDPTVIFAEEEGDEEEVEGVEEDDEEEAEEEEESTG